MKFSQLLLVWFGTGVWTIASTSVAISLEAASYHTTNSTTPGKVAYWVAALGVPICLALGNWLLAKAEVPKASQAANSNGVSVPFVFGSTLLFWFLMFALILKDAVGGSYN